MAALASLLLPWSKTAKLREVVVTDYNPSTKTAMISGQTINGEPFMVHAGQMVYMNDDGTFTVRPTANGVAGIVLPPPNIRFTNL